mgnify:FL=1
MAHVNIVGFESGDTSECNSTSGTFSVQTSVKRTGAYALRCNPTTTATGRVTVGRLLATGATTVASTGAATAAYFRFYFRFDTAPASNDEPILAEIQLSSVEIRLTSAGKLAAYDINGILLATGATTLSSGTFYRIEFKSDVSSVTDEVWEVKIDGVSEISGTTPAFMTEIWGFAVGKFANKNGNSVDYYFDDIAWRDDAYPGAGQIEVMQPSAAGNYQTFTRGGADSGNNWDQADELPHNSDTNYLVSDNTVDHAETEALESAASAGVSGTINCAKACSVMKRDGASNGAVRQRVRSGSTDSDTSSNYAATAAYALIAKLHATDPATGSAWLTTGLDGLETGAVEKSATNKSRMTATYAVVDYTPAAGASAALTGTATAGITEADVVAGAKTLIITLTGDTFVASGGAFDAIRQDIIDGLDSAQAEGTGWNAEVRDNEVVAAVVRTSATVVTITLTAAAAYDITATETITVTVPAAALVGGVPLTASPTFTVTHIATGKPTHFMHYARLRAG